MGNEENKFSSVISDYNHILTIYKDLLKMKSNLVSHIKSTKLRIESIQLQPVSTIPTVNLKTINFYISRELVIKKRLKKFYRQLLMHRSSLPNKDQLNINSVHRIYFQPKKIYNLALEVEQVIHQSDELYVFFKEIINCFMDLAHYFIKIVEQYKEVTDSVKRKSLIIKNQKKNEESVKLGDTDSSGINTESKPIAGFIFNEQGSNIHISYSEELMKSTLNELFPTFVEQKMDPVDYELVYSEDEPLSDHVTIIHNDESANQLNNPLNIQSANQLSNPLNIQSPNNLINQLPNNSANQLNNNLTNQLTNQLSNPLNIQSANQSANQLTNNSTNQLAYQSANQSTDNSANQLNNNLTNQLSNPLNIQLTNNLASELNIQSDNQSTDNSTNQLNNQSPKKSINSDTSIRKKKDTSINEFNKPFSLFNIIDKDPQTIDKISVFSNDSFNLLGGLIVNEEYCNNNEQILKIKERFERLRSELDVIIEDLNKLRLTE